MSCINFIYSIENLRNGNIIFCTDVEKVEELAKDENLRVTCKNYMKIKKIKGE